MRDTPMKALLFIDNIRRSSLKDILIYSDNRIYGLSEQQKFYSRFEPVYSSFDSRLLGYRAITEYVDDEAARSPVEERITSLGSDQIVAKDRLIRIVHVLNFLLLYSVQLRLFLPVTEALFNNVWSNYGMAFRKAVNSLGLLTAKIVLELPEFLMADKERISIIASSYHINGFEICVNLMDSGKIGSLVEPGLIDFYRVGRDIAVVVEKHHLSHDSLRTRT
jgi:EAL domain-containing protein (putative c-di-GMP-specific phosphodiesterase class I)